MRKLKKLWKWLNKNDGGVIVISTIIITIFTIIISWSAVANYISIDKQTKAIEGSYLPQIYYSQISEKCPSFLSDSYTYEFSFELANYGKIPVSVRIESIKDNIWMKSSNDDCDLPNSWIFVPIEYMNNEKIKIGQNIEIENISQDYAYFLINWSYEKKNLPLGYGEIFCYYEHNESKFVLVENINNLQDAKLLIGISG